MNINGRTINRSSEMRPHVLSDVVHAPMVRGMENVEVISNVIDKEIRKVLEGLSETPLPAYLLLHEDEEAGEE